jgi:hypothetical protein
MGSLVNQLKPIIYFHLIYPIKVEIFPSKDIKAINQSYP